MKSKLSTWFECKIRYEKTLESGKCAFVTESYVVEAMSFKQAEDVLVKEISAFISGDFEVKGIKKASYREILFSDALNADLWFKAKLQFVTLDEKSGKEKTSSSTLLIQSDTFNHAVSSIAELMKQSMIDYITANVQQTSIMDVFKMPALKEENP